MVPSEEETPGPPPLFPPSEPQQEGEAPLVGGGKLEAVQLVGTDPAVVVDAEVLDLAHSDLIQRSVTVTTRLDPSLPSVAADRGEFS